MEDLNRTCWVGVEGAYKGGWGGQSTQQQQGHICKDMEGICVKTAASSLCAESKEPVATGKAGQVTNWWVGWDHILYVEDLILVPIMLRLFNSIHYSNMPKSFRRLHSPSQLLINLLRF